jgi:hypothetical protein
MAVRSFALGISGQCDIVEIHPAGEDLKFEISDLRGRAPETAHELPEGDLKSQISNFKCTARAVPVEYKRGKPKSHRADEVQLCAQGRSCAARDLQSSPARHHRSRNRQSPLLPSRQQLAPQGRAPRRE